MLATQTPDMPPEATDVKQIKEKLAQSLKALQKRYVTSDAVVTSEDGDANLLCCALEAIFIHGIKAKFIRSEAGGRNRKPDRGGLPQPFFWSLLKTVTHRDVITELEKISFVSTDVGRCRAWLRLALNHGLLECYLASLFREDSKLQAHYQPSALLLNAEEREVLLSYLQGLASLTFSLSYKSAVLNEWTTTPLALAGLCPLSQADLLNLPLNGGDHSTSRSICKEVWDTASQSSGSSDALDLQRGCPVSLGKSSGVFQSGRTGLHSSNLSLDTTGSSQLSSSLSSDSLLQGQDPRSPTAEQWSSCDLETPINVSIRRPQKDSLTDFRESGHCSQDSMHEDSFVSSSGPDQFSENIFSGSDSETQGPPTPSQDPMDLLPNSASEPPLTSPELLSSDEPPEVWNGSSSDKLSSDKLSSDVLSSDKLSSDKLSSDKLSSDKLSSDVLSSDKLSSDRLSSDKLSSDVLSSDVLSSDKLSSDKLSSDNLSSDKLSSDKLSSDGEPVEETPLAGVQEIQEEMQTEINTSGTPGHQSVHRSTSILSRKLSSDSLSHSHSWISEDDIYKPHLEEVSDSDEVPPAALPAETKAPQSPPSVVHRRQIGLSNPFRGLLKLGHLERRGAMGMWKDYYCELSPFEFRLYSNSEERTCYDNCSLLRCEDARITSSEGRFELVFPGKRVSLRAANRGEAEDWVDRIVEAVNKCRPASRTDEQWEVLQPTSENGVNDRLVSSPSSAPSSPERGLTSSDMNGGPETPPLQDMDWTRTADLETDSIKEAVLYFSTDPEARTWSPLVFSLSLESLKGFRVQNGRKLLRLTFPIEDIRDIVPDVSLGGPAFFKLLTIRETLRIRAENQEEARSWRALIRGALDSYLESGEDGGSDGPAAAQLESSGNLHRLVQHRLKEDGVLLAHLCTVPSEKGLDAQNFKCAGCPQQIGPSQGRSRLCEFSGQYYCESCHGGETSIIPSRMLHNWDLTQREVSKKAVWLLVQVQHEPLLNLEQLNPELVRHSESMCQIHSLRERLRLLGDYLLTCRSGASKSLQARMGQRTYLMESTHLYSVMDLRQIAEGHFAAFLLTLLDFASSHVFHCDLCTQRGFICQVCHSSDIIFPFQFGSTTRCKDCKAVFHLSCKTAGLPCPRCQRMKKYLERDLHD
ncbi:pleckstrin homology domain-containing family M member 1 isoform X1 [Amphiprion ocellaris]|uniref:Pleckstrin homology domain containing, family M (with RUN domain) member 1 n=1 Tax=Amphiprion ocellaris TaxID=80972 RepID=A0A3Q1B2W9_AMPOC|nr:pleckstrin homology domain-containing family M member 1 isoform X1 [Amphiprion ocellaris]XP_035798426.2 pleckstrin homology domain-containing family M member 1 isoform X1 [Amphiprion ocellaris]XP_054860735.1 pleckstrin homology domain-containing family M member 1 isoform X1 [Amphiprion ocellaris]